MTFCTIKRNRMFYKLIHESLREKKPSMFFVKVSLKVCTQRKCLRRPCFKKIIFLQRSRIDITILKFTLFFPCETFLRLKKKIPNVNRQKSLYTYMTIVPHTFLFVFFPEV